MNWLGDMNNALEYIEENMGMLEGLSLKFIYQVTQAQRIINVKSGYQS
ncbi:hypothetical protein [Clostridium sp.]